MNREKETKTIQDQIKRFFKANRNNPANIPPIKEFVLTNDMLRDLGREAPVPTRIRTMKELSDIVLNSRLETNGVEKIWMCIQDLFLQEYPADVRHSTFVFLQTLIKGQFGRIDIMRAQFFRFIKHHDNPQDISQRIELLSVLTNDGREVEHFEEEIGPFLLNWLVENKNIVKLPYLLTILDNVIKFNSTNLDEYIMTGYVRHVCVLCCDSKQSQIVLLCLQILGTIVAYSILPAESLPQFVGTLCQTVNHEVYCQMSWKVMRNLLGTHLGHSTLYTMCNFLEEPNLRQNQDLICGGVFYIHMALWDTFRVSNLICPPSSVMPSMLEAVKSNHPSVNHEVVLGLQKLINKHALELLEPTWKTVLEILLLIIKQYESNPSHVANTVLIKPLHEILTTIENDLIQMGRFNGSLAQFYGLIHECLQDRPETSVLGLVKYHSRNIRPTEPAWMQNLYTLLGNYFRPEIKTNIRLKILDIVSDVIQLYGEYEDELIDRILVPHFSQIANDDNIVIRSEVAKLLINLCMDYTSNICMDILDILEKLLLRPFEKFDFDHRPRNEAELFDINIVTTGLVQIFAKKIHRLPSTHAIRVHKLLVLFLEKHAQMPVLEHFFQSRITVLQCLLSIRADSKCRIGYPDPNTDKLRFSTYLCVTHKNIEATSTSSSSSTPPPNSPTTVAPAASVSSTSQIQQQQQQVQVQLQQQQQQQPPRPTTDGSKVTYLNMESTFKIIISLLETEKVWEVFIVMVSKLPEMLANKPIVLSKHGNAELSNLLTVLCELLYVKSIPDSKTIKVTRPEYQKAVVSALAGLASYSASLDRDHQLRLIHTLYKSAGLDPRCSRQSINALTVCMVDMREAMMKALPDVLLKISKISATVTIAWPILEFLSTLSQLPSVYGNFVSDQYMAVFAITLPYTNPFKYEHSVVSMAYHVISVWFLKCRLPYRRDFVRFILSGLQTNVIVPFKELQLNGSQMNQDSSDRKRSSSLTEQGSRRRIRPDSNLFSKQPRDSTLLTFYEELNETCIDLMARYAHSPCSTIPRRSPTAEFLLKGGVSKSWMLGNKLVTITTSGCSEKVLKQGVCEQCWNACGSINKEILARYGRSSSTEEKSAASATTGDNSFRRQSSSDKSSSLDDGKRPSDSSSGPASGSGSGEIGSTTAAPPELVSEAKRKIPICACWCSGWAEIYIRRPTGNVSWIMKIQNVVTFRDLIFEFPLNDFSNVYFPDLHYQQQPKPNQRSSIDEKDEPSETLGVTSEDNIIARSSSSTSTGNNNRALMRQSSMDTSGPSLTTTFSGSTFEQQSSTTSSSGGRGDQDPGSPMRKSLSRQTSRDSAEDEDSSDIQYDDGLIRSRNPVRRSNSSPEMANWKNPFAMQKSQQDKEAHDGSMDSGSSEDVSKQSGGKKDNRVSCEAIPEEISGSGTSPPNDDVLSTSPKTDLLHRHRQKPQQSLITATHPSLLTCHSYPGGSSTSPPKSDDQKPYKTVPPSPNTIQQHGGGSLQPPTFPLSSSSSVGTATSTTRSDSLDSADRDRENNNKPLDRPNNLPNLGNLVPLSSKPPQSPTQTSPRLSRHLSDKGRESSTSSMAATSIQKSSSSSVLEKGRSGSGGTKITPQITDPSLLLSEKRNRLHTISVMSTSRKQPNVGVQQESSPKISKDWKEYQKSGINPNSVFLQLYHSASFAKSESNPPLPVPTTEAITRAISILDKMYPFEVHKIGVLYINSRQADKEVEILRNTAGSTRYMEFLNKLGTLVRLSDVNVKNVFLGGISQDGSDGKYMYIHHDDLVMLAFHVGTMMPNRENDPNCNHKKAHIGNCNVLIVYNNSGEEFDISTFKSQVTLAFIIVEPLECNSNRIRIKTRDQLSTNIGTNRNMYVSDQSVSIMARQLAVHCDLAATVLNSLRTHANDPYASTWLERLRRLKHLRQKITAELASQNNEDEQKVFRDERFFLEDFTDFT